jgi:hypothetical protein
LLSSTAYGQLHGTDTNNSNMTAQGKKKKKQETTKIKKKYISLGF